jgi:hypothetical protein
MTAGRRRLLLAIALAAGFLAVGLLPRPPDMKAPPGREGWSPRPAGTGEAPTYPAFRDVSYVGVETWIVGADSTLIWSLGVGNRVRIRLPLGGEVSIDHLRLERCGGALRAGAPEVTPASLGVRFADAFKDAVPFDLSFPDPGTFVVPEGGSTELFGRLRGPLGPGRLDVDIQVALSQPGPDRLLLQGKVQVEAAIHEWGPQWRQLRSELDALNAGEGTTTVELILELRRPPR